MTPISPHRAYSITKRAVNRVDPIGLLACGAPSDEYAPEIRDITELVLGNRLTVETARSVFWRWFQIHVPRPTIRQIVGLIDEEVG